MDTVGFETTRTCLCQQHNYPLTHSGGSRPTSHLCFVVETSSQQKSRIVFGPNSGENFNLSGGDSVFVFNCDQCEPCQCRKTYLYLIDSNCTRHQIINKSVDEDTGEVNIHTFTKRSDSIYQNCFENKTRYWFQCDSFNKVNIGTLMPTATIVIHNEKIGENLITNWDHQPTVPIQQYKYKSLGDLESTHNQCLPKISDMVEINSATNANWHETYQNNCDSMVGVYQHHNQHNIYNIINSNNNYCMRYDLDGTPATGGGGGGGGGVSNGGHKASSDRNNLHLPQIIKQSNDLQTIRLARFTPYSIKPTYEQINDCLANDDLGGLWKFLLDGFGTQVYSWRHSSIITSQSVRNFIKKIPQLQVSHETYFGF